MGGVIYSGALRGGFLDCSRRSGRCASILGFADCGARGGNSHAYASASYKEGGDVERKAGYHSARGYGVPVLRGAIVDAGFAMVVPALRSGEERGGAKLETRKQRRENRQKHRSEDRPPQWRARALIGAQWLFLKTQLGRALKDDEDVSIMAFGTEEALTGGARPRAAQELEGNFRGNDKSSGAHPEPSIEAAPSA